VTATDDIRALLQRFARAVDRRDVDALAALFHPDATVTGARGSQTLDEWLDTMRAPRTFPVSMHLVGDPLITHEEGSGHATSDAYAVVFQLGDGVPGSGDLTLGIDYVDELIHDQGRWLIRSRVARTLWMR
jgi:ketosteroid isomerase-like protein